MYGAGSLLPVDIICMQRRVAIDRRIKHMARNGAREKKKKKEKRKKRAVPLPQNCSFSLYAGKVMTVIIDFDSITACHVTHHTAGGRQRRRRGKVKKWGVDALGSWTRRRDSYLNRNM